MKYAVLAHMRSGSSMMMQCLNAGGLPAHYDQEASEPHSNHPGGLFELRAYNRNDGIVRNGHVVKVLTQWLSECGPTDHAIALFRNPREIRMSYLRMTWQDPGESFEEHGYRDLMEIAIGEMEDRCGATVLRVDYGDVLANPFVAFDRIRNMGWPISPQAAASVVNQEHYRCRAIP